MRYELYEWAYISDNNYMIGYGACAVNPNTFIYGAAARLKSTQEDIDVWLIDHKKELKNSQNEAL